MSRIASSRGRFAKTRTGGDGTDTINTSRRVAKAVGITAISLAGVAAVGVSFGTEVHHKNTVKMRDDYRRDYEAEQKEAEMDRRVEKLIEKHRKRQKIAAARAR